MVALERSASNGRGTLCLLPDWGATVVLLSVCLCVLQKQVGFLWVRGYFCALPVTKCCMIVVQLAHTVVWLLYSYCLYNCRQPTVVVAQSVSYLLL